MKLSNRILWIQPKMSHIFTIVACTSLCIAFIATISPYIFCILVNVLHMNPDANTMLWINTHGDNVYLHLCGGLALVCFSYGMVNILISICTNKIIKTGNYIFYYKDGSRAIMSASPPIKIGDGGSIKIGSPGTRDEFIWWPPEWKANRSILSVTSYDVNGRRHGEQIMFYTNGEVAFQGSFVHGVCNGVHKAYEENGLLRWEINYAEGKRNKNDNVFLPTPYTVGIFIRNEYLHSSSRLYE